MNDVDQMRVNEFRRIELAIDARKKAIARAAQQAAGHAQPRRYVIEAQYDADDDSTAATNFVPVAGSVIIDRSSSAFYCEEIAATIGLVGNINVGSASTQTIIAAKVSVPVDFAYCNFNWEVRDTFTDRSWQSKPLPKAMLASGRNKGFQLARPVPLPGGTEITTTITPLLGAETITSSFPAIETATSYFIQMSFIGYEVLL